MDDVTAAGNDSAELKSTVSRLPAAPTPVRLVGASTTTTTSPHVDMQALSTGHLHSSQAVIVATILDNSGFAQQFPYSYNVDTRFEPATAPTTSGPSSQYAVQPASEAAPHTSYPVNSSSGQKRTRPDSGNPSPSNPVSNVDREVQGEDDNQGPATSRDREDRDDKKPKRVRTGCLTCRSRHLKCDEGLPTCQNCIKSERECLRGLRVNFVKIDTAKPPIYDMCKPGEWHVRFQDDSRDIYDEYPGGVEAFDRETKRLWGEPGPGSSADTIINDPRTGRGRQAVPHGRSTSRSTHSSYDQSPRGGMPVTAGETQISSGKLIEDPIEQAYMQVYVEEVAVWMDSLNPNNEFAEFLPFKALHVNMLYKAFLACGSQHLHLVDPDHQTDEEPKAYYQEALRLQEEAARSTDREDLFNAATTAVVLGVYESMSLGREMRLKRLANARDLMRRVGWNGTTEGIGGACFWLHIAMIALTSLSARQPLGWNPDEWMLDMNMQPADQSRREYNEVLWARRMFYIACSAANFDAEQRAEDALPAHSRTMTLDARHKRWLHLHQLADTWERCIPRVMKPMYQPYFDASDPDATFPKVWLLKRTSITARLFYHMSMVLLARCHPLASPQNQPVFLEMQNLKQSHSMYLCGIVAYNKDRGVASTALNSLLIAAECLLSRRQQQEIIQLYRKIQMETGWAITFILDGLKKKWQWSQEEIEYEQRFYDHQRRFRADFQGREEQLQEEHMEFQRQKQVEDQTRQAMEQHYSSSSIQIQRQIQQRQHQHQRQHYQQQQQQQQQQRQHQQQYDQQSHHQLQLQVTPPTQHQRQMAMVPAISTTTSTSQHHYVPMSMATPQQQHAAMVTMSPVTPVRRQQHHQQQQSQHTPIFSQQGFTMTQPTTYDSWPISTTGLTQNTLSQQRGYHQY